MSVLDGKIDRLHTILGEMERVVVCFSGGVDSSFLLAVAAEVLGDRVVALTAVSPSLAAEEGFEAKELARRLGVRHLMVETNELDDPRYASNPVNRCYFCKTEMYGAAVRQALEQNIPNVLDGFNLDDRGDHRPGQKAAREQGVRSPLAEAGFTKADIREAARDMGLPVWDKPALACLSSRFPYGTEITPERLTQVARSERALRALDFRVFRVRYHGPVARVELPPEDLPRALEPPIRERIVRELREAGFTYVTVDLEGYRRGSLNRRVAGEDRRSAATTSNEKEVHHANQRRNA